MPYTNVTLAQLRGYLDNQLGAAAGVFWGTAEKNFYLNEALRVFNAMTGYWKQNGVRLGSGSPAVTVANQVWYSLPGTVTSGMRLTFNGKPMMPSSLPELDQGRTYWESETTASGGSVPTEPQLWAMAGVNLIAIWPADAAGGNSLLVDGISQTPSLVNDSDYVDIGSQELNAILDYAQHVATFKEGGLEFKAAQGQLQSFIQQAGETNGLLKASSKFREWMGVNEAYQELPRKADEKVGTR